MGIISELYNKGINFVKTDDLFRGLQKTENDYVLTRVKSKCDKAIYFLKNQDGKILPCGDYKMYVTKGTEYEGKTVSKEDAERLAKEGKIFSFNCGDVYAEYYDFANDKDLECCFKYGYSAKRRNFIESLMNKIGLVEYTDVSNGCGKPEGEPIDFEPICSYDIMIQSKTNVGKFDTLWLAQTCYWFEEDDFAVIKMWFNHMPSESDVKVAFEIIKLDSIVGVGLN